MDFRSDVLRYPAIAMAFALCTPAVAQTTTVSSAVLEAQIATLQTQLAAAREAEARQAIADAGAAERKADAARQYLASIGKPVPSVEGGPAAAAAVATSATPPGASTSTGQPSGGVAGSGNERWAQPTLAGEDRPTTKFGGIDFGVGIAFTYDLGSHHRVKDAAIVDGVVRVNQSDNVRARLILESHYLFTPTDLFGLTNLFGLKNAERTGEIDARGKPVFRDKPEKEWGIGPFVALQPGTDNVIDAIGAGLMLGLKRPGTGNDSFNIGIGMLYDIDARILGDGITENQPLPGKETEIRYKTRDQKGLLIMTSYSF